MYTATGLDLRETVLVTKSAMPIGISFFTFQILSYEIDVFRDLESTGEEDIYLDEFNDEIDEWVLEALKNMGCTTAKAVLRLSREEVAEKADLEDDTVEHVFNVLQAEFEN